MYSEVWTLGWFDIIVILFLKDNQKTNWKEYGIFRIVLNIIDSFKKYTYKYLKLLSDKKQVTFLLIIYIFNKKKNRITQGSRIF